MHTVPLFLILSLAAAGPPAAPHARPDEHHLVLRGQERQGPQYLLRLVNLGEGEERPEMAVYALDRSNQPIHVARVGRDGRFDLPEKILSEAQAIAIGPVSERFGDLDPKGLLMYRTGQFQEVVKARGALEISRVKWETWVHLVQCASGSVTHCRPYPWIIADLAMASTRMGSLSSLRKGQAVQPQISALGDVVVARSPVPLRFRCRPVCDGIVEVYRRTCCCWPIIVEVPEIEIPERIPWPPPEPWPPEPWPPEPWPPGPGPGPGPDPAPWENYAFLKGGTIDERALNAAQDAYALRSLPQVALEKYVASRPWLYCTCGTGTRVAQGAIGPNGEFNICWLQLPSIQPSNCHVEYSFVVKQVINGTTVVIYDGPAAGKWFDAGESADLVSYHPLAIECRDDPFPEPGAYVMLDKIGATESHHLDTPNSTGWDRVAPPDYNDGLVFPAATPAAAVGAMKNCNWGGRLHLRYHFSDGMRSGSVGAKYYRVSVVASNPGGNPTGTRTYLTDGVVWKKMTVEPTPPYLISVESVSLGPNTVGGESNLFLIPYYLPDDWLSGQYNATLDTTLPEFPNGRYLVTLEVFDAGGNKIKPNSAPGSDPGSAKPFTFRRWYQPTGPTAEVPYGALTHMFWWDNRRAQATIVDLRKDGVPNMAQCQFLVGNGSSQFSVGYRAYHQNPMFQLYHRMWWVRGLGGPSGNLTSPVWNPNNVGKPPAAPGVTPPVAFAVMLAGMPIPARCSFSLNLRCYVKTYNGHSRMWSLDTWDQAAFALEIP